MPCESEAAFAYEVKLFDTIELDTAFAVDIFAEHGSSIQMQIKPVLFCSLRKRPSCGAYSFAAMLGELIQIKSADKTHAFTNRVLKNL